ncbi:dihydrolipoyl dehydrogenase [Blattabacterium sp. (Cryptocercus kyebangensis)]|uniref:dihydrolipoyl dehydrogenase n=1 Tax=Blattabacterium sp. (Cryptocercus kyebangensis) TaxID=298656 RepID=UPI000D7D1114|nr:dihydrolipoyl dehydrogenase [Blattabacterium sp. (Cryptocercus kyebangensis)]AWU43655.1 dihydrolipoyl dehydrogenase [Blattabacterium sp. (Cryptocercus kyebangensis)]
MNFDVIVLGSGPGGYVASIRAAQLGMKTAIVERESLGGICLNWGCIPTKSILNSAKTLQEIKKNKKLFGIHQIKVDFSQIIFKSRNVVDKMRKRISFLMKKNGIHVINGEAKLKKGKKIEIFRNKKKMEECYASHIIIATGGKPKIEEKFQQNEKKIIGYREALSLSRLPRKMIIIGSGSIGLEFSYFYHSMGTEVILIELCPKLFPSGDEEISDQLKSTFDKVGIKSYVSSFIKRIDYTEKGIVVNIKTPKKDITIEAEIALSAIGTIPNINIGLEEIGIQTKGGFIVVDEKYRTNIEGYYAVGDVIEGPSLAHVASHEAISCIENIKGLNPQRIDYDNIPKCIYCSPEIASVGYTEKQAKEKGYQIKVGKFPFHAIGKAICDENTEGFVKVIFDEKYDEWLGCHMIGNNVSDLISEVVVARKLESTNYEIMGSVHPHPSLSESILESIFHAYGKSIHL